MSADASRRAENKNVQQNSGDVMSMKLWIQLVRYSGLEIFIDEVKFCLCVAVPLP